jgi:hypothetical protein
MEILLEIIIYISGGLIMRRYFIIVLIFSLLFTSYGCNLIFKSSAEKTTYEFVKNYFTFYDTKKIIDNETYEKLGNEFSARFKPLMTEKAYSSFISNKEPYKVFDIAAKGRATIEIKDIKLKLKEEYKEDNSLYYEYSGVLFITPLGNIGPEIQSAHIAGEIILTKQNNSYKNTRFIMRGTTEWFDVIKNFKSVL